MHFKVMVIMVIDGYLWLLIVIALFLQRTRVILVIGDYQWLSEVISVVENNFIHFKVMVIMVINGYLWLLMVITVYLQRSMVILVIGGYQWLSEVISVVENNFMHFKVMVIMVLMVIYGYQGFIQKEILGGEVGVAVSRTVTPPPIKH